MECPLKHLYVINLILFFAYYIMCDLNHLYLNISLFLLIPLFNLKINHSLHHLHLIPLICSQLNKASIEPLIFTVTYIMFSSNIEIGYPVKHLHI
jgi:hypothetical protein